MPLKGNPKSTGRPGGLKGLQGPLGLHSKAETWSSINRYLEGTGYKGKRLFTLEEKKAVDALNTGLNARQLANIFHKTKRQFNSRFKASFNETYTN